MTLQSRDRRALALLGVSALLALAYRYWPAGTGPVGPRDPRAACSTPPAVAATAAGPT